mgnify:CR=1 FL=1
MINSELSGYFSRFSRKMIISLIICFGLCSSFSLGLFTSTLTEAFAQESTKKAIVFYKNDCEECDEILHDILPRLVKSYQPNLSIIAINNSYPEGGLNYLDAMLLYNFSAAQKLPLLLIDSEYLSGAEEIKEKLPEFIKSSSGSHQKWKQLESIPSLFTQNLNTADKKFAHMIEPIKGFGIDVILKKFERNYYKDEAGNRLAVVVLTFMLFSVIGITFYLIKGNPDISKNIPAAYPVILLVASGIAIYLFYSGITNSELTCGPVGECNTVQQSKYAVVFGFIPVSLLGTINYCIGIMCWFQSRRTSGKIREFLTLGAWGVAACGVVFFIYLTFLEPFIIGASCAWCLSAAVLTTLSAFVSTAAAKSAYTRLRNSSN